ncbi:phosphoesterase [Halosimplex rubrum]|uniref:Phosphoesterase n=2 Tax=Halosimplex rubrum TaxID=869889 RepID=A0A7D5T8R8_9EURY|nr:phosphoesterase [Halosimplex rubrum]
MSALGRAIDLYGYVFHPITVLGVGSLLLIYHEWRERGADRTALWRRVGAFLGAGALALVPTAVFFLAFRGGLGRAVGGSSWRLDEMVAAGVLIAAGVTWLLWRRYEWGPIVPPAMVTFAAVTVPYAALAPVWDISGHVILALAPTLYLTLVDRRYAPLLAVPVLMVPTRVLVEAHTWAQSVAGFAVAAAITVGLYRVQAGSSDRRGAGSTAS